MELLNGAALRDSLLDSTALSLHEVFHHATPSGAPSTTVSTHWNPQEGMFRTIKVHLSAMTNVGMTLVNVLI